ncbi:MAG: hypothetical protein Kow0031_08270 [Anaerolineae bacterium]
MVRLSTTAIIIVIALISLLAFSSIALAFSPESQSGDATVEVQGFTPTPTRVPGGGSGTRPGGGGPSIPEPTTVILTGLGLAGLAGYVARKKRHDSDDDSRQE